LVLSTKSGILTVWLAILLLIYSMSSKNPRKNNLITEMRDLMRRLHYSIHTENAYCDWITKYIRFHQMQARETLFIQPEKKVKDYLTYLAVQANVAASTQNHAFNALVFLYKRVLEHPLEGVEAVRTRREPRVPVVLTREEVKQVLALLENTPALLVKLLYGCGLRITEAVRLRVQDIDYGYKQVTVRSGKGMKDRVTPFPESVEPILRNHLERVKAIHTQDLAAGYDMELFIYRMLWLVNIQMRKRNGI